MPRAVRRAELAVQIKALHEDSDGVNGALRILADLREAGQQVSRKTVAKIMADEGIRGISPRPWTPATTIADDSAHSIADLVARVFDTGVLNRVWTSAITYLDTGQRLAALERGPRSYRRGGSVSRRSRLAVHVG